MRLACLVFVLMSPLSACAPRIIGVSPVTGAPGTLVSLPMENLVGWPRVEIAGQVLDWPQLKLMALAADRQAIRGEDLVWIEDKILQFRVPDLPPGDYPITIHDDKGPPGQPVYSFLETTAYALFPPVWPYLFRTNRAQAQLRILPRPPAEAIGP
jgi:hypothetical protein